MCWNLGPIVATGPLVGLSGLVYKWTGKWDLAWMVVLLATAAITLLMGVYHLFMLPTGTKAPGAPASMGEAMRTFGRAFATFFDKKGIFLMIAFALFYRSAYGMMEKMGPVFMINPRSEGGLGLSNEIFSTIYGTGGSLAFIVGSILGGLTVARYGLKRSILVLCLCLNVPNITFLYLSQTLPMSLTVVTVVVLIEKLAWGFGAVAHMLYMMQQIAPGPYQTAHYSIATGLMGLCMIGVGMLSGVIQEAVGFKVFFVIALAAMIPSILVTLLAPFHVADVTRKGPPAESAS
jgi:PAT family beta-lactamase induction signal transducer AmpG